MKAISLDGIIHRLTQSFQHVVIQMAHRRSLLVGFCRKRLAHVSRNVGEVEESDEVSFRHEGFCEIN